jgi:hypothetical protein
MNSTTHFQKYPPTPLRNVWAPHIHAAVHTNVRNSFGLQYNVSTSVQWLPCIRIKWRSYTVKAVQWRPLKSADLISISFQTQQTLWANVNELFSDTRNCRCQHTLKANPWLSVHILRSVLYTGTDISADFRCEGHSVLAIFDLRLLFVEIFILITITGRKNHLLLPGKGALWSDTCCGGDLHRESGWISGKESRISP